MILKTYYFICKLYNVFFSFLENIIQKKKILSLEEYYILTINRAIKLDLKNRKNFSINKYLEKFYLNKSDINYILNELFIENKLKKKITEITGFNYFVGYIIAYKTKNIPENDINLDVYANKWHKDKPFTKNTLKLIVPLQEIGINDGGIKIKLKKENTFEMICKNNELLMFFPNKNFHKAGNPTSDRDQIMIQLNPSRNWSYNSELEAEQTKIEPKFPFFYYLFKKKLFFK